MQEKVENLFLAESNETAKHFGSPISYFLPLPSYIGIGPCPIQLVVVMAVRKAVRAATITFTATSTIRFVFITPYINSAPSRHRLSCLRCHHRCCCYRPGSGYRHSP